MEGAHTEDPHQATEHVRLFEVDLNEFTRLSFDVLNGLSNVRYLQFRGKRYLPVESFCIGGQDSLLELAHAWNGNESARSPCAARRAELAGEGLGSASRAARRGMACSAIW